MSINHLCAADTSIRHLFVPPTKKQCSLCQGQCSQRSWLESPRLCNTGQCCSARIHNSSSSSSSTLSVSLSSSPLKPQESGREEKKKRVYRQYRPVGQQTFFAYEWAFWLFLEEDLLLFSIFFLPQCAYTVGHKSVWLQHKLMWRVFSILVKYGQTVITCLVKLEE